jgi:PIN domain nuclease of toxin-antitoxin system
VILLDTNVVLWLAFEPDRISTNAANTLTQAGKDDEPLAICAITLLEVATLRTKNRISLDITLEQFLQDIENRFTILPITARACARIPSLPSSYPQDPADRIIGATALVEGLTLVTADRDIRRFRSLRTLW